MSKNPGLRLRDDADADARRAAARALADALRPSTGSLFVELGDSYHPEVPGLLDRARALPLRQVDTTGVVWEGPSQDPGVWAWALDALPWASCWELHDAPPASTLPLVKSSDSLSAMWVTVPVAWPDLRAWLVPS